MANIKFFYNNIWDNETLETSSEDPNYPAENTQQRFKRKTWNATGDTTEYIRTTGGSSLVASGFFVFYHNITSGGTVTVKGSNTGWVSSTTIGTMTRTDDLLVYIASSNQTYDDYGIFIADAANPDGIVKLGRVWIGVPWEPTYGYTPKVKSQLMDPSLTLTTTHGAKNTLQKNQYRTFDLPFDCLELAEYETFFASRGTSKSFVILKKPDGYQGLDYPDPEENSFYVSMTSNSIAKLAGSKLKVSMKLEEER